MTNLNARVKAALEKDPRIVTTKLELETGAAMGYPLGYIESLGLTKSDLIRLERHGLAMRGRLPTAQGHQNRWVLLAELDRASEINAIQKAMLDDQETEELALEATNVALKDDAMFKLLQLWANSADEAERTRIIGIVKEALSGRKDE